MIVDNAIRLATSEVTPNGGAIPGGIGAGSAALNLDGSGATATLRNFMDIGAGQQLVLAFSVNTGFTCSTFNATIEFQLVSLPISLALLTGATGSGKTLTVVLGASAINITTDNITLNNHNLPLGTPIYLTSLATTTGISNNTIYYVVPDGTNTFKLATSLTNALAGTTIDFLTGNGTATVNFIPTIHASSGSLRMFNAGSPTNQGPLRAGSRFIVPVRPLAVRTGKQALPTSQERSKPLPVTQGGVVAPGLGLIAGSAQRYFALRYLVSNAITAGAVTCDLTLTPGDSLKTYASAFEVIG